MREEFVRKAEQIRLDALCARNIHRKRLTRLRGLSRGTDVLTIVLPVVLTIPRFVDVGTYQTTADVVVTILSILLFAVGLIRLIGGWQEKAAQHLSQLTENLAIKEDADHLLSSPSEDADATALFKRTEIVSRSDENLLADASTDEKRKAYLNALREVHPAGTGPKCPVCNANPWKFSAGSCAACGNTPIEEKSSK